MVAVLFNHEETKANETTVMVHASTNLFTPTMLRCSRGQERSSESPYPHGNKTNSQSSLALGVGLVILLFRLSKKFTWRSKTAQMPQDKNEIEDIENGDEEFVLDVEVQQIHPQEAFALRHQREQQAAQQSPMVVATKVPANVKTIVHFDIEYDLSEVPTGLDAVEIGMEAIECQILQIV